MGTANLTGVASAGKANLMASRKEIEGWTRELLRLSPDAEVEVKTSRKSVHVEAAGRHAHFDVPPAQLHWAQLARALLELGPSCIEKDILIS